MREALMTNFNLHLPEIDFYFPMIFVQGTGERPYLFGAAEKVEISIKDFYMSKFTVTQRLWEYLMGNNPAHFKDENRPVENVSFLDITNEGAFLDRLNGASGKSYQLANDIKFRLPSETEWEYAARGGTHWEDGFLFSGSNDMNAVGWYDGNSGLYSDPEFIRTLKNHQKGTKTYPVGQKIPNQLGICDMCGNVWEWCEDYYWSDIQQIPKDGTPCLVPSGTRVLRGGCHHNGKIHCTVSKRYEIVPDAKDECISFRIVGSVI